jgi:flagellar biosynthesis chaperone FliJ
MSLERRRQAQKILDTRQRAVDLAEAELGALARKTLDANAAAEAARVAWRERLGSRSFTECSSHDLTLEHMYVVTLEKQANLFAALARDAKAREETARLKVCTARTEHKKVETWRDRLLEASRFEEARLERLQGDEVAARISRKA